MSKRKLSPMEIYKRAKHDGLWVDGSGFDGESEFHRNSKGQMLHEWIREKQSFFVTEVGDTVTPKNNSGVCKICKK
tara:strand:- start:1080 stop:1307 length:228 start_codon:yes stop_codon:yes gene_type:complete